MSAYLTNMLRDSKRSIYEHVVYDSATERDFADALETDDALVLYAKLPGWFKVPTPLGYEPLNHPCSPDGSDPARMVSRGVSHRFSL